MQGEMRRRCGPCPSFLWTRMTFTMRRPSGGWSWVWGVWDTRVEISRGSSLDLCNPRQSDSCSWEHITVAKAAYDSWGRNTRSVCLWSHRAALGQSIPTWSREIPTASSQSSTHATMSRLWTPANSRIQSQAWSQPCPECWDWDSLSELSVV